MAREQDVLCIWPVQLSLASLPRYLDARRFAPSCMAFLYDWGNALSLPHAGDRFAEWPALT